MYDFVSEYAFQSQMFVEWQLRDDVDIALIDQFTQSQPYLEFTSLIRSRYYDQDEYNRNVIKERIQQNFDGFLDIQKRESQAKTKADLMGYFRGETHQY